MNQGFPELEHLLRNFEQLLHSNPESSL